MSSENDDNFDFYFQSIETILGFFYFMADALSVIPPAVLRNLSDKLYEKRKNAALEIEGIVKQLAAAGEHDKITAVINLLANEFTYSAQVNHRKGGLIGLATATVALTGEAAQHLEILIINLF
ncbi:protein VAC14 homolog isoform X2 [Camellia sinensis]|uniref:protein VAC14 homolog isoform X2 n=1 Tax=Camellia sinensis TaxID=4442 RepID=UPI00103678AD|nr:protein VAC14 homolog isoform X2 [Camellia sinensis]